MRGMVMSATGLISTFFICCCNSSSSSSSKQCQIKTGHNMDMDMNSVMLGRRNESGTTTCIWYQLFSTLFRVA
jgi:hypothetical protein